MSPAQSFMTWCSPFGTGISRSSITPRSPASTTWTTPAGCTARRGIAGAVACRLPPHLTVCRRHRLWTGPSARTHAGQLDVSQLPEILRAQRRHLAQLHRHPWQQVDAAISDATRAIHRALRVGIWNQALAGRPGVSPGRQDDGPGHSVIEIAIYPDVVWLAARSLQAHSASHRAAS
jgi:hypothetical protein